MNGSSCHRILLAVLVAALGGVQRAHAGTAANGIDGSNIVGAYQDSALFYHGFLYDGSTWTSFDVPGAVNTWALGIDDANIVGTYQDSGGTYHGYRYDGASWTTIAPPGAVTTWVYGVVDANIVGWYADASNFEHGFVYNGATWTTLDVPGAVHTRAQGIDDGKIVGFYEDGVGREHAFRYNGVAWTTLDAPGARDTRARDIDNGTVIGEYLDDFGFSYGFLYDGVAWTTLDSPGTWGTWASGIDGANIVGAYKDGPESWHGFLYDGTTWTRLDFGLNPLYRFWSPVYKKHFYTTNASEKAKLLDRYAHVWTYEGIAYYVYTCDCEPGLMPVYRFWSPTLASHFYTIGEAERDKLINTYPHVWTYEGPVFYAFPDGAEPVGTMPVYRFWSVSLAGHFYTISETERDKLVNNYADVWTLEGIAWYAYEP